MPFETDHAIVADYLLRFAELADARVLDIGCATGRLMRRYARVARSVVAIDPDGELLSAALRACRPAHTGIGLAQARAEALPFRDETFDVVILAWSF